MIQNNNYNLSKWGKKKKYLKLNRVKFITNKLSKESKLQQWKKRNFVMLKKINNKEN